MPNNVDMLSLSMSLIIIPWCVWVTVSLFNQRQEIAVLKEILKELKYRKHDTGRFN